jgi:hypothetical protein
LLVAMAGGSCGFLATAHRAQACECVLPEWVVHLKSVTSSDPQVDDSHIWPETGRLYSGEAGDDRSWFSSESLPGLVREVATP